MRDGRTPEQLDDIRYGVGPGPGTPPADGGTYAHRCGTCAAIPRWSLVREGDVVVTWSCPEHLHDELERLQRDPRTIVRVTPFPRRTDAPAV